VVKKKISFRKINYHKMKKNRLTIVIMMLFAMCTTLTAQIKIFIETDLEGVSGVFNFTQTREKGSPENLKACEYFMGDLAAVVKGLRDGGATEIIIIDGHGNQAMIPDLMVPGAVYVTGKPKPDGNHWNLDNTFSGIVMFGFHAMNGTKDGVLNHTQSSKTENKYWYNGVESGELAQTAIIAGHFGVPPILVTGDVATCREAVKFFGNGIITVATKEGVSREAAALYPFEDTRKALYEGAKKSIAAIPACKPYIVSTPIKARMEYLDLDPSQAKQRLVGKEWIIPTALQLLDQ
jgi:D-amino peptidase